MSRPQSSRRPIFYFRNPFRMILPKRSDVSSKQLLAFEKTMAGRIEKITPAGKDDALQLSWMTCVVQQLIAMHEDLNALIGALELPASDRKNKWVESYVENVTKLLDVCNAFTSHIRELQEGHHHLHIHLGAGTTSEALISAACSSLDEWMRQQVASTSPSLDRCLFPVMDGLPQTLDPPKAKNASGELKILMKALYGVRVVTLFACSAFAASFSRCTRQLRDLQVPETYSWAQAFGALEAGARRMLISNGFREVEAIEAGIDKLNSIVVQEGVEAKVLVSNITSEIRNASGEYTQGLLLLSKEMDNFFAVLLSGRNALTDKLMGN